MGEGLLSPSIKRGPPHPSPLPDGERECTEPAATPALSSLLTAAAVRERCRMVHRWVADGRSAHFTLDEGKLPEVAGFVAQVTRAAYPDLRIPPHSRWRHFDAGSIDRWGALA